jgi:hypothetical protein
MALTQKFSVRETSRQLRGKIVSMSQIFACFFFITVHTFSGWKISVGAQDTNYILCATMGVLDA